MAKDPDDAFSWYQIGKLIVYGKEVITALENSIRLDPTYIDAWMALGKAYRGAGQRDSVREAYKKLQQIDRNAAEEFFEEFVIVR